MLLFFAFWGDWLILPSHDFVPNHCKIETLRNNPEISYDFMQALRKIRSWATRIEDN